MTLENYLSYLGKTLEEFKEERKIDAEKNIKTRLVLQRIISENEITITEQEVDQSISDYASNYQMTLEDFKKAMRPEDFAFFENNAIMTKVLNFIKEKNENKK